MSDINITVNDEIVNIDVIDEPVLVNVVNSPGQQGPAGPGVPVGGTAGQILAKASATDYDTEWINNYAKYLATNVRNQTGSTIGAFQVVYISGATGNKPLVSLADADTEATSSKTYGVTATSIANNGTGDVVTAGELSGINTSAFNEGDLLWLSTTAGGVVTTPPAEPAHAVFIGYVVRSHPTLGVIDVAIANGYELNELHGVQITSAANNDGLFYNIGNGLWENKSINTALGFTPANAATTLTINGVTYDLSTSRTWTIAAGISGSGASGQVTYWTGASAVSGSNNLFWDNANSRLGIGTNTPQTTLSIKTGGTGNKHIEFSGIAGVNYIESVERTSGSAPIILYAGQSNSYIGFVTGNSTEKMRLHQSGNLVIGGTVSSDLGVRLGVVGDTLLRGSGNTNATTALTVQNSSSTNLFVVQNHGSVGIGSTTLTATTLRISKAQTGATSINTILSSGQINSDVTASVNNFASQLLTQAATFTLGSFSHFRASDTLKGAGSTITNEYGFNVDDLTFGTNSFGFYGNISSGTGRWNLYMNGTADNYLAGDLGIGTTSVTNWLNIGASTTAKAHINLAAGATPTAPANGDIWFDGTDIKMRIGGVTKTFTLI